MRLIDSITVHTLIRSFFQASSQTHQHFPKEATKKLDHRVLGVYCAAFLAAFLKFTSGVK